ncbi:MAG: TonB family protein [Syntrophales bacterium]|nr:TonB family protein [Syntrophales bacterium]MDD5641134.1 TonB family protein [Syntrophales bacterium]
MMPTAPRNWGILISVLCHGLIMLIPISLAVKAPRPYPPVEFVMTLAEKPMVTKPPPRVAKPEPVRPKNRKVKPRPLPQPIITEPVKTNTSMPRPVAAARPQPAPAPAGPVITTFGSATGPAFLRRSMPVYPDQARWRGLEGKVVLRLSIDARGNLLKVEVLQTPGWGFAEAAVAAVKRSSFRPATMGGKPVACIAKLPIRFVLR